MSSSPHCSLVAAQVRSALDEATTDEQQLRSVLTSCFFEGSVAAAEIAAHYVLCSTESVQSALFFSEVVKSLPTAVPERNVPSLAQACVFLCLSFDDRKCGAPLLSFCYAGSDRKDIAARAVNEKIFYTVHSNPECTRNVLDRAQPFFTEAFATVCEPLGRNLAIVGLIGVCSACPAEAQKAILSFLLDLGYYRRNGEPQCDAHGENEGEVFIDTMLVSLATDQDMLCVILRRSLVAALQLSKTSVIHALWTAHKSKVCMVLPYLGYDVFLLVLTTVGATSSCRGTFLASHRALSIVKDVLIVMKRQSISLDDVVRSAVVSMATSVGTMAMAGGVQDIVACTREIIILLNDIRERGKDCVTQGFQAALHGICEEAQRARLSDSVMCLVLLWKLISLWKRPKSLDRWYEREFPKLSHIKDSETGDDIQSAWIESVAGKGSTEHASEDEEEGQGPRQAVLCTTSLALIAMVGLSHDHSRIRYRAALALRELDMTEALIFFLPSVIAQVEKERNGTLAAFCFRSVITSPCLLSGTESSKLALRAVLCWVNKPCHGSTWRSTYHTGLAAIADAAEKAPTVATSILQSEIAKLQEQFGATPPGVKAAACAAIVRLARIRPSRGTAFVQFLNSFLTTVSMEIAPQAGGLCFEAMSVMAEEEVLDPAKTLKIVLKSFPDAFSVPKQARRGYLRLLGCAGEAKTGRKGRQTVARAITELRNGLTGSSPVETLGASLDESKLTWEELGIAAESLVRYKVEDILRVAHDGEEPLSDAVEEKDRLESIESECMEFIHVVLSITSEAQLRHGKVFVSLEKLLGTIARHEWSVRSRSSFDPTSIAKLRASSEVLRRARRSSSVKGTGISKDAGAVDRPTGQFLRAVKSLPTGVVKALCERCASPLRDEKPGSGDGDGKVNACSVALTALLRADALSSALPWTELIQEILLSKQSNEKERAAALAALSRLDDTSFQAATLRAQWFGGTSPLFEETVEQSLHEAREIFEGMMLHHPGEISGYIAKHQRQVSVEQLDVLIDATREVDEKSPGFHEGVKGLLRLVSEVCIAEGPCSRYEKLCSRFVDKCLARCVRSYAEELLMSSTGEAFSAYDTGKAMLASQLGSLLLLRRYVEKMVCCNALLDGRVVSCVGDGLGSLAEEQRGVVLRDLCFMSNEQRGDKRIRLVLAAHCLHVAALLPDAKLALAAAPSICKKENRDAVRDIVSKLTC